MEDSDSPILIMESNSKRRPLAAVTAASISTPSKRENRRSIILADTIVEKVEKNLVIQERIHPIEKEEIQPVIFREREQTEVKQVTQLLHETEVRPTLIHQRQLPAESRELVEKAEPISENIVLPSRSIEETKRTQVVHQPIVNTIIKKTIIEEVQPILERDVIAPLVIRKNVPIYETVIEAPRIEREFIVEDARSTFDESSLRALSASGFDLSAFSSHLGFSSFTSERLTTTQVVHHAEPAVIRSNRRSLVEVIPSSYAYLKDESLMNQKMTSQMSNAPVAISAE